MCIKKSKPKIITFLMYQDAFLFLGIKNFIEDTYENADMGAIWGNFFKAGGYDKIIPYAVVPKPMNVCYTNDAGTKIYFQGMMVADVDAVPDGYTLEAFPAGDYLVVTTEWMKTHKEALGENGLGQTYRYHKTVQIPEGYIRYDGVGCPFTVIEKENTDTPDGSRYEFWVPIKKVEDNTP